MGSQRAGHSLVTEQQFTHTRSYYKTDSQQGPHSTLGSNYQRGESGIHTYESLRCMPGTNTTAMLQFS